MKWRGRRSSRNIEDRRGRGSRTGTTGRRVGAGGIGGIGAIAVVVIGLFLGVDPGTLLGIIAGDGGGYQPPQQSGTTNAIDDDTEKFVSVVLADTEAVWEEIFRKDLGRTYQPPQLVLFSGQTQSACGAASAATGPFYCPPDKRAFLDTSFFATLEGRLGASGDFARAYVIAHEIAHHVQNELGILPKINRLRAQASEVDSNRLSVLVELQADCFSGVWARRAEQRFGALEPGDIKEALNAAAQIGDDALQRRTQGYVVPDSFTHGTSAQRVRAFQNGYAKGDISDCELS